MTNATTNNHDSGETFTVMPARSISATHLDPKPADGAYVVIVLPGEAFHNEAGGVLRRIYVRRFGKMAQLMDTFIEHGDKWFSPDTMRFWKTRILGGSSRLLAGCVFITSEAKFSGSDRVYSVRMAYYYDDGDGNLQPSIMTIASYMSSISQARSIAYKLGSRVDKIWPTFGAMLTATQYKQAPTPPMRTVLSPLAKLQEHL